MAFWCRIKQSKLKHLTNQLKRYYIQVPSLNHSAARTQICAGEKPIWSSVHKPTDFFNNVRFFAASVQGQRKKEDKDNSGTRLNDEITAQFVRLVSEEGHKVIPRHEALALARKLELDLVEVQRHANPPVCKIMDFHREKYKKEVKDKERAKAKSDVTLKADCKEVRFSGKIEQKDLQMKADTVKRLAEKGYRVKCMALPASKKGEAEDLGGYLSRFTALIEDIAIVESGPHVERKQAYVVIRHVKFGPKKGGGKKSKLVGDTTGVSKNATHPPAKDHSDDIHRPALDEEDPAEFGLEAPPLEMQDKKFGTNKTVWSVSNSNDDFNEVFGLMDDTKGPTPNFTAKEMNAPETAQRPANLNAENFSRPEPGFGFPRAGALPSQPAEPALGTENRYKRSEPRNQLPQKSIDNRGSGVRESFRSEPQFPSQRQQPPPNNIPRQEPPGSGIPNTQRSSYGIFSNPTANTPPGQGVVPNSHRNREGSPSNSVRNPGTAGVGANQNIPTSKSDGSQSPGLDNGERGKFGIFSK